MDKLKTLKTAAWENIEAQASRIHELVSKFQAEGKSEVSIKGNIHKVNKAILETNGFDVTDRLVDFRDGERYFVVSWK